MIDLSQIYPDFPEILERKVDDITRSSPADLGPRCEEACVYFRTAAIASVLVALDTDGFYHHLIRAAHTRLYLLEHTKPAERDASRFCKASRANGFFAAVAAGSMDLARGILQKSPQQRNVSYEYEEEYAYVSFLYGLLLGAKVDDQRAILDGWKDLLDGQRSAKHDVCRALLNGDPAVFDGAFERLLDAREKELYEEERSLSRVEIDFAGGRYIYIEGLAILRFAEALGVKTKPAYRFCPREARLPMRAPFPNDLYPR